MVTMYGYAGYANHGYVTWLYHCDHVGYAKKCGYATWLSHMRLRLLRQIQLHHMIMPHTGCAGGEKLWKKYQVH